MQTFRSDIPLDDTSSPKNQYTPFVPDDAVVTSMYQQPLPPIGGPSPQASIPVQGTPPPVYGYTDIRTPDMPGPQMYYAQPEYTYYPPTPQQFRQDHGGMDREQFRYLVIGLLLLGLIAFIIMLIIFTGRGSRENYLQQQRQTDITVFEPRFEETISPEFAIVGEARGYWFYDGEFNVTIFDSNDALVARGTAEAQSDWRTDDFVPFQALIKKYDFIPQKKRGYIVLERSEKFDEFSEYIIPIEFATGSRKGGASTGNGSSSSGTSGKTGGQPFQPKGYCSDGLDNDKDALFDIQDPECHTDFNPYNASSYDEKAGEFDKANKKPKTSSSGTGASSGTTSTGGTTNTSNTGTGIGQYGFSGTHDGQVTLYFGNINNNPFNPSCDTFWTVNRSVGPNNTGEVVLRTLTEMIRGPRDDSSEDGLRSGVKKGLTVEDLDLKNGTLSIYFAEPNIVADPNFCSLSQTKEQIETTMLQFADVNEVRIYAAGNRQ